MAFVIHHPTIDSHTFDIFYKITEPKLEIYTFNISSETIGPVYVILDQTRPWMSH